MTLPDEGANKKATSAKAKSKSPSSKRRSEARRRKKIEEDVKSRTVHNKDVFALQQQLVCPAAAESLMEAARGLLQPDHYDAIVEERGVEGLCGYPPCSRPALGVTEGKKWTVNPRNRTVHDAAEIGNFCAAACRRASGAFKMGLQPDPSYVRSASAVSASREAIAAQKIVKHQQVLTPEVAPSAPAQPVVEDASSKEQAATEPPALGGPALPNVRQKAVVKLPSSQVAEVGITKEQPDNEPVALGGQAVGSGNEKEQTDTELSALGGQTVPNVRQKAVVKVSSRGAEVDSTMVKPESESAAPPGQTAAKVRQKAVVKFSRTEQTYTVRYNEYDGGGGIPGVCSNGIEAAPPAAPLASRGTTKKACLRTLLAAPVLEREAQEDISSEVVGPASTAESAVKRVSFADDAVHASDSIAASKQDKSNASEGYPDSRMHSEELGPPSSDDRPDQRGQEMFSALQAIHADATSAKTGAKAGMTSDADDDDDDDFYERLSPEDVIPTLPLFVRAWGVLASWLHDRARETLWQGKFHALSDEEDRPDHAGRRELLNEVLLERLPGDLSFMAPRLAEVIGAFQLHDTLPTVNEVDLYDLLGALILRAILVADVYWLKRRPRHEYEMELLAKRLEEVTRRCGMQASEVRALELQLEPRLREDWSRSTVEASPSTLNSFD